MDTQGNYCKRIGIRLKESGGETAGLKAKAEAKDKAKFKEQIATLRSGHR